MTIMTTLIAMGYLLGAVGTFLFGAVLLQATHNRVRRNIGWLMLGSAFWPVTLVVIGGPMAIDGFKSWYNE